jgi:hypothetical protein
MREGVLEWNKAFEKAGFANAIEVRQQPDDADWDPEDINYNTLRWITAGAGFARGPSRVNPLTGEILDADLIFDSDFLSSWKDQSDFFRAKDRLPAATDPNASAESVFGQELRRQGVSGENPRRCVCQLTEGLGLQLALGAAAAEAGAKPVSRDEFKKMLMQAVKELAVHEVGHTLGLRHNFKASGPVRASQARSWITCPSTSCPRVKSRGITSVRRSAPTTIGRSSTATSRFPAAPRERPAS